MKKIFSFAKKKKSSTGTPDNGSVLSVGYELKDKDLGKVHKAASVGDLAKLKQLATKQKNDINQLDKENRTALHIACAAGHVDVVQFLVESKAKLNLCDNQNRSALMKAVQGQHEQCVSILLENHAEPNLVDSNGNTALHLAANIPSISTAALLLEHEANKNASNKEGLTPLSVAVREDHIDMAEFLLKEGADVNTTDENKRSPLMVAASNGQIAMLRLLLRYNADSTQTDTKGWSAEDYAANNGHHPEHSTQRRDGASLIHQDQGKKKKKMSAPSPPAEAGFSLGGPASDKDDFEDNSQSESLSRVSKSGGDDWPSSDNDDESPSIAKKSKKFNIMKMIASKKGGVASVQPDTSLSDVESEPELENPTQSATFLPKALPSTSIVPTNPVNPHPDSHPFKAPQMTSTPLPAYKKKEHSTDDDSDQNQEDIEDQDDEEEEDSEEEEEQLEESEQSLDAASTIPEGDTSKDKKRDFMSELGLEKGEQDSWDSESDSGDHNSPLKKEENKGLAQKDMSAVNKEMEKIDNSSGVADDADTLEQGESSQKESEKPKWEQLLNKPEGASDQKTDLMEELGLGDVDDLEDASDWDSASTTSKRTLPGRRLPSPGIEEFPETSESPNKEENILTTAPVMPQRNINSRLPSTPSQSMPHPQPRARKMTPRKSESQEESDWDSDRQSETHMMEAVYQQALDEPESPEPAAKSLRSTESVVESEEEEEEPEERHDAVDLGQLDLEPPHPSSHPNSEYDDSYNLRDHEDPEDTRETSDAAPWEKHYEKLWVEVEKREVKTTYKSVTAELKARFGELFKSRQSDTNGSEEEEEERAENLAETSSDEDEGEVIVRPMARARQTTRLLTIPEQRESGLEDSEVSEMTEDSLCEQAYEDPRYEDGKSPELLLAGLHIPLEEEEEYTPSSSYVTDIGNLNGCSKASELELENQEVLGEDDQEGDHRPYSPAPPEEVTNDFTYATRPDLNIDSSLQNNEIIEEDEGDDSLYQEVRLEGRISPELELATRDEENMPPSSHPLDIGNKNECSKTPEPDNQDLPGEEEEEEYMPSSPQPLEAAFTRKPGSDVHLSYPLKGDMEPVDEEESGDNNEDFVEPQPPTSHRRSLSVTGVSDEELEEDLERFKFEVGMLKDVFRDLEKEKAQLRKEPQKDTTQAAADEQQLSHGKNGKPNEDVGSEKHEPVLGFRKELSTQAASQEKAPVASKRTNGAPAKLHYSLQQSHKSSRKELKSVEETKRQAVVRGAQLRAPQTHRHVNGDPLSVFDDSSLSEVSEDEGRMPTEVKKNENSEEVEMAEDFDDLTQSSDTATDDLDCPSAGYRHAALLVEKLDSTSLDSRNMVKLQNIFHEYERTIQKLKSRHSYLSDKVNQLEMEKVDMKNSLEEVKEVKSTLERNQLELQTEVTNLKFQLKQEQENRRNATMMYNTTKDKLKRLEEQQQFEVQEKQKVELTLRNLELEMRTLVNNMKQLEEDHSETQRLLAQERSARALQENLLSSHLRKQQAIEEENKRNISKSNEALSQLTEASDRERELLQQTSTLQEQITILRGDLERSQANSSLKESHLLEENETLKEQLEDARREVKANSEALTQTVFNCNNQLTTLKSELTITTNRFENERQARETLEREVESTRTRLTGAIQEAERCMAVNADTEKALLREKEENQRLKDRLTGESASHREAVSSLSQKLSKAESQANSLENEVHRVTLQLTEKGLLLDVLQKEKDQLAAQVKELDKALQSQKELVTKTGARHEATQERLAQVQSEGMLLRQQLEEASNKGDAKERAVTDAQERFSDMLSKLRSDSEERVQLVEERNKELSTKAADLRDQIYKLEEEKNERETSLRQLQQELADSLKKLSMSEASLEVNTRYRSDLEEEKTRILKDLDRLRDKLTESEDQYVQAEKRVNALKSSCDEKEKDLAISAHKLQEALSASAASASTIKQLEEAVQGLEIENAKLEAAAKQQSNKIEALQKGAREAGMVRGHLEELVSNLQSSKMTLEDQLNREVQKQSMLSHTAQDSQALWEEEMKSRSKLGLRLAELEKEKGELNSQMEIEKKKAKKIAEQKKAVDARLDQEMNRNSELQKEMYRLRTLLKTAKKKMRDQDTGGGEFNSPMSSLRMDMGRMNQDPRMNNNKVDDLQSQLDRELSRRTQLEKDNSELRAELSSLRRSGQGQQQLEQELLELKRHMEATQREHSQAEDRTRQELQHKLEQVNLFLQTQAASQEALEQIKAANQASVRSQLEQKIRELEGEVSRARSTHRDSLSQRDSSRTELERYKHMYSEELRLRKSLAAKLERSNSRLSDANSKLLSERSKSLIASSFVNSSLGGPTLDGGSLGSSHLNRSMGLSLLSPVSTGQGGRVEDYLAKMRSELDRNISKELSSANEELDLASARLSPVGSASMDPVSRATQQYLEVLKKNYKI